jgi:hypothetical protein
LRGRGEALWVPRLALLALLASCAPGYSAATRKPAPVAAIVLDAVAFSVGMIVGINEMNKPRGANRTLEVAGFATALAAYLPYWFISTDGPQ